MESEFQYQGKIGKDTEEWLSPRGRQINNIIFYEEDIQDTTKI